MKRNVVEQYIVQEQELRLESTQLPNIFRGLSNMEEKAK